MSVLVAIKTDEGIYVGADTQVSYGDKKYTLKTKIDRAKQSDKIIVGGAGALSQVMAVMYSDKVFPSLTINGSVKQTGDLFIESLTKDRLRETLRPNIINILREQEHIETTRDLNSSFLIVVGQTAYTLGYDGHLEEIGDDGRDYLTIGSGWLEASVVLDKNKNKEPKERIQEAIEASINNTRSVGGSIVYLENEEIVKVWV